jgi:hypothetical protein
VTDEREARSSTLRLDRRARWSATGASPFGVGFRGVLAQTEQDDFWLYEEGGARIWIHLSAHRRPVPRSRGVRRAVRQLVTVTTTISTATAASSRRQNSARDRTTILLAR